MKIFDNEQEWLDARGIATASQIGAILGHSVYDTPHDMWLYATGQKKKIFTASKEEHMARGKEREAHILDEFHERFASKLDHCQFVDQPFYKTGDMSATLDRIYFDNETDAKLVVEAKSTTQNWLHNQWRVPPSMYLDQVYFQMELSGAKKGFLIWEQPNLDYVSVEEVYEDKEYQTWVVSQAEKFIFCVEQQVPFEPDYFEPPYLEKLMNIYGEILEIEESSKRIRKEVMKVFGGETTTDAGVWSFETRPVRSSGFSAPKLREVFAGQEDLLEQCRYKDSVKKEIVFTPNFVDNNKCSKLFVVTKRVT